MRRAVLIAVTVVYSVAAFPAAIAAELPGSPDPAVMTVPFSAAFALAFVPLGWLADRIGWTVLLLGALAGVAAGGVALALTSSPEAAAAARALQGAAAAGLPPAAQALLARAGGSGGAGRAISGMMIAVAVGTLGGPLVASALVDATGWRAVTLLLAAAAPAATAALAACAVPRLDPAAAGVREWRVNRFLVAGCGVAALVLAGYWTLLTRFETVVAGELSGATARVVVAVAGLAGIALVMFAGRAVDRSGPRKPMVAILGAGGLGALAAAAVDSTAALVLGTGAVLALYWSYLPVVSVQVQRSAPESVRATALGLLYTSMWLGAALGGVAAALLPDGAAVVAGVAVAWLLATVVAAVGFHRAPVTA